MLYFRWITFLSLTILSIIGIMPTIEYYSNYFGKQLESEELIKSDNLKDKSLTLGLDLQGGIHMVLELDLVDLYKNLVNDEYKNDFDVMDSFEKQLEIIYKNSTSLNFIDNLFNNYEVENLDNYYSDLIPENLKIDEESQFLKQILKEKLKTKLLSSTEIMRNRIDALGVTEPLIQTKGINQIIVEIAGIKDTNRAESLIKNTGKLEFIFVKDRTKTWLNTLDKIDDILFDENEVILTFLKILLVVFLSLIKTEIK